MRSAAIGKRNTLLEGPKTYTHTSAGQNKYINMAISKPQRIRYMAQNYINHLILRSIYMRFALILP